MTTTGPIKKRLRKLCKKMHKRMDGDERLADIETMVSAMESFVKDMADGVPFTNTVCLKPKKQAVKKKEAGKAKTASEEIIESFEE